MYLEAQGRSTRTVGTYQQRLSPFLAIYGRKTLERVKADNIDEYVASLRKKSERYATHSRRPQKEGGLSPVTVNGIVIALKALFSFGVKRGYTTHNPTTHLKARKPKTQRIKAVTVENLARLLETAESGGYVRDVALIRLLADSGARCGEIAGLKRSDLHLNQLSAHVHGKTGPGWIEYSQETAKALKEWLCHHPGGEYVFCSLSRKNLGQRIRSDSIRQILLRHAKRAGITGQINPHGIRHLVGQIWAKEHDLERTRQKLRHADIATTVIYANVNREEIKRLTQSTKIV